MLLQSLRRATIALGCFSDIGVCGAVPPLHLLRWPAAASFASTTDSPAGTAQQPSPLQPAAATTAVHFYRRVLPSNCLAFNSPEGKRIFREALEAGYMEGYFALAAQYRTQDDPAFCGLATLVMCLNSLAIDPGKVWKGPWRWFHEEMLDCCVPVATVRKHGLTLAEFACLASCNGLHVQRLVQPCSNHGGGANDDAAGFADFEATVRDCCRTDASILVASYSRQALGQTGDGHFAPIGGFNPDRRLVLLFDPARFKYPPHWVPLRQLWDALKLPDSATGRPRGYCVLARASSLPAFRVSQHFAIGVRVPDSPFLRLAHGFDDWLAHAEDGVVASSTQTNRSAENGVAVSSVPTNGSANDGVAVSVPTNGSAEDGVAAAVATLALAARQLGDLCELYGLDDFVLCQQGTADEADAVLSALRSLPAYAPVCAAFGARALPFASQPSGGPAPLALLVLLAWPLRLSAAAATAAPKARAAHLSVARDHLLIGAPDCLTAEVQLLRNQLATIFGFRGGAPIVKS